MVTGSALITLVVTIIILAVIFKLVEWFIAYVGIGDPFNMIIRLLLGVAILIYLLNILTGFVGHKLF